MKVDSTIVMQEMVEQLSYLMLDAIPILVLGGAG